MVKRDPRDGKNRLRTSIAQMEGGVVAEFILPGVKKRDISITVEDKHIIVKGGGMELRKRFSFTPQEICLSWKKGNVRARVIKDVEEIIKPQDFQRCEAEAEELRRRLKSLSRDLDFLRKKSEDERERIADERIREVAEEMIDVMDNLDRALHLGEEGEGVIKGIRIIKKSIENLFKKVGIEEIKAENEPLNPSLHHVVESLERDDVHDETVIKVIQKGYTYKGRVIRPSMVVVARQKE